MEPKTHIIIAIAGIGARTRALGYQNKLLWHLPADLQHFKDTTKGHPIIMGSKTWDSLPIQPLPGRSNIVLSRSGTHTQGAAYDATTPEQALELAKTLPGAEKIYIVGGGQIYALFLPYCTELDLTLIEEPDGTVADTFFPEYTDMFTEVSRNEHEQNELQFAFTQWRKK